jgi:hypothetical protein
MAFLRLDGSTRKNLPSSIAKKASVAMNPGDVVISTSGQVDVAVAASVLLLGIATQKISSSDSDFAATTPVVVAQIDPNTVYVADVGTGTATVAMIGAQYDLKDADEVDVTASTFKQVKIVGIVSASKVLVTFNPNLL